MIDKVIRLTQWLPGELVSATPRNDKSFRPI